MSVQFSAVQLRRPLQTNRLTRYSPFAQHFFSLCL